MKNENLKITLNSIISLLRIFFTTVFSLLTVRYLISALGVEQYGIYALVTGVVTILTFLNSAMTVATQRYLSFYRGNSSKESLSKIFKSSILLHLGIGLILLIVLFLLMNSLIKDMLNIDSKYHESTYYLYYGVVFSIFFNIVSVPFNALLVSHENFRFDALVLILKALLMFVFSLALHLIDESYRMVAFSAVIFSTSLIVFLCYVIYCRVTYSECNLNSTIDRSILISMTSFAIWSLYTNLCYVLNTQGINVIINKFFGASTNAAYGIAFQINGQIKNLSQTLISAMNPQIMRSEGKSNRERAVGVSVAASKVGFFLVSLVTIPCFYILPRLIEIWLGFIPDFVLLFTFFFLFSNLVNQLTVGVTPAIQAVGKIKRFQMVIGTSALTVLPISYLLLEFDFSITYVLALLVIIEAITGGMKIYFFSEILSVKKTWYLKNIIVRMVVPFIIANLLLCAVVNFFSIQDEVILVLLLSSIIYIPLCYIFSLDKSERKEVKSILLTIFTRFKKRK